MRFAGSGLSVDQHSYSGGGSANFASAAGAAGDLASNFSAMREKAPRYDQLGAQNMSARSSERQAAMQAEASVTSAGIGAVANVHGSKLAADSNIRAAEINAEASLEAADKAAASQKKASTMGAIGGIAAAGIGLLSDERTKHSIEDLESVTMKLRQLRPVTYYYKQEFTADPWRKHHGFIAQEFKHAMPDATIEDKVTGMLSIAPVELIAVLVKGYQELDARITRCEVRQVLEEVAA